MPDGRLPVRIAAHKIQLLEWREAGCYRALIILSHYKCCDSVSKTLFWRLRVQIKLD